MRTVNDRSQKTGQPLEAERTPLKGRTPGAQIIDQWEVQWSCWARSRAGRLRFAEWQVIYPELAEISLAELIESGTKGYYKRTGKNDDEILAALIQLGQAGDEDAFVTAGFILAPRISMTLVSWTRNGDVDDSVWGENSSALGGLMFGSTFDILCKWNLATHPVHIGNVFAAKLRYTVRRQKRYEDRYWKTEGAGAPVLFGDDEFIIDGVGRGSAGIEDEALFWVTVDEAFERECFGRCEKTKTLVYERLVNGASLAEASRRAGLTPDAGRKRMRRVRPKLRDLAAAA